MAKHITEEQVLQYLCLHNNMIAHVIVVTVSSKDLPFPEWKQDKNINAGCQPSLSDMKQNTLTSKAYSLLFQKVQDSHIQSEVTTRKSHFQPIYELFSVLNVKKKL